MSEKRMSIGTLTAGGVTTPVKLQSKEAQAAIDPNSTAGTDKGDTPYRLAMLSVSRICADATDPVGTCAVYTCRRPNPRMAGIGTYAQYAQELEADGVNAYVTTKFDYAAFSLNNWIVELNGVPLTYDATPADLTEFSVSDSDGYLRVTIGDGDPLPAGRIVVVQVGGSGMKATLLADGDNFGTTKIVNPYDYVWLQATEDTGQLDETSAALEFFYR